MGISLSIRSFLFGLQFFCPLTCHTMFGMWVYHHGTMCRNHSWPLYDIDLSPQYKKIIFHHEFKSGKIVFAFWQRHTKFGIWVYQHKTKYYGHFLSLTYMWAAGVSLVSITHSFYFVYLNFLGHILVKTFKRILHLKHIHKWSDPWIFSFVFCECKQTYSICGECVHFFLPSYNYLGIPSMSAPPILNGHICVIINNPT